MIQTPHMYYYKAKVIIITRSFPNTLFSKQQISSKWPHEVDVSQDNVLDSDFSSFNSET